MSSPIVAVAGLEAVASPVGGSQPPDISVAASSAPPASAADAASFASQVSQMQEVRAPQPSAAQSLGQDLAHRLQDASTSLSWQQPGGATHAPPVASAPPAGQGGMAEVVGNAMSQLQGVYAFAIQATLASRASTESTKVFNTLLKGQ